ncbi:protoporphyrinogen/coproporphyrinogen oxidase [Ferruginibacter yonginensis]|uniref:Protoporphyrinogen/coproporphyrinogen oxidase n=1 Tax=Ferruginibacter yonginensis TaxID=1310416 RepID=A0ABV8QPD8_9BACT
MEPKHKIYIIGAGVSGLIAAYELEQMGYHPIIIEQTAEVGGRVKTIQEKGYALDLGFQVLLSAYPLAKKYLDMDQLQLNKLESGAFIYANNKSYLIGDPLRNWKILIPTLMSDIGSIADKLKILKLNIQLKFKSLDKIFASPEKTTLEYLVECGFSSKIIERFFKPFFTGIFLEPDLSTSSRMFEFVYKMFGEGYATIPELGIGAITKQLQSKLHHTEFMFNCGVKEVTNNQILLQSGETIAHKGVIIASSPASLLPGHKSPTIAWKKCMCLYFEVNQTNIPANTIALIADAGNYTNNLYAYTDAATGKTILSATTVQQKEPSIEKIIEKVIMEVQQYTGASLVHYIQHYEINFALPDIKDIKMTALPSNSKVLENVFVAGDYLFNGSLNAAMESGRLAALGIAETQR